MTLLYCFYYFSRICIDSVYAIFCAFNIHASFFDFTNSITKECICIIYVPT